MNYDNYERAQGWSQQPFGLCDGRQAAQFEVDLEGVVPGNSRSLRVLDIGFGNGSFLGWARRLGWDCEGIEVNPRMVGRAREAGFVAAADLTDLRSGPGWRPYDLVTAFDVLEHIDRDDLVPFLASLRTACLPATRCFFRFPNGDSPFAMPLQNGDVTHRTSIGQGMIRQVAELADFDVLEVRSPRQALRGLGVARRVAVVAALPVRWVVGEVLRHLFMGSARVALTGNLVTVLRARGA